MTFEIGNNKVGDFLIWVSATSHPDYFNAYITEGSADWPYYVHLHRDSRFPMVEFKFPPKPIKMKKKGDKEEEVPETEQEVIYRAEYHAYAEFPSMNKDMTMPPWYLHRTTLEKVLATMKNLSTVPIA